MDIQRNILDVYMENHRFRKWQLIIQKDTLNLMC